MSFQNSSEFNSVGTGAGLGGGGFGGWGGGGIGGFGLFGLIGLLGRRGGLGGGDDEGGGGCAREAAILAAIGNAKDVSVGEARGLAKGICDVEMNVQQSAFQSALLANQLADQVKAQGVAFQIANDNTLNQLSRQISADGDATRALINSNTIQDLRDQLLGERRRGDHREIEISIQNSNAQSQAQVQAQFQSQNDLFRRHFQDFDNQLNNTKQGIINLGTMVASGTQSSASTNIK